MYTPFWVIESSGSLTKGATLTAAATGETTGPSQSAPELSESQRSPSTPVTETRQTLRWLAILDTNDTIFLSRKVARQRLNVWLAWLAWLPLLDMWGKADQSTTSINAKNAPQDRGAPLHALLIIQTTGLTHEIQPLVLVLICANHIFVHNRIWIAIVLQCFTHLFPCFTHLFPCFTSFASSMPATFSNFTPFSGSILMASSMQPLPECIKCVTRCCTTPLSIQSHYIPLPWSDMICLRLHNSSHWLPRSSKIVQGHGPPRPSDAKHHDLCLALVSQSGNATSTSTATLGAQEEQASQPRLTMAHNKGQ